MKRVFLGLCLLAAMVAYAGESEKLIYEALDVEAYNPYPGMDGSFTLVKEVGGLSCFASEVVYPGSETSYCCYLDKNYNGKLIYEALDVEGINPYPDMVGYYTLVKEVGGLECSRSAVVYPGVAPSFICVFN